MPVSRADLEDAGIKLRRENLETAPIDPLTRYKSMKNHGIFLYTSEDDLVSEYFVKNWDALDGLTGDTIDIHCSLLQLRDESDAYQQMPELRQIPGLEVLQPNDLPALHIWSDETGEFLLLRLLAFKTKADLTHALRCVVTELAHDGGPITQVLGEKIAAELGTASVAGGMSQAVSDAIIGGNLIQINQTYYQGGKTMADKQPEKANQIIEDVKLKGNASMKSDVAESNQFAKGLEAKDLDMDVSSKKDGLSVPGASATGPIAIVCLVILAIAYFGFQYLSGGAVSAPTG